MSFDPVQHGHQTAKENAKTDVKNSDSSVENLESTVEDAQKLAKKNAKLDRSRINEAEMSPQDVGTAERDIPEGAPVTDEPEESEYHPGNRADSKNADVKKDLPDDKKRQDTDKDSATPSPSGDNSPKETPVETTPSKADKK